MSRVLIIEDEVEIADLEKDYLELSGFEVEIENDGTVGLKRALTEDFDMYILDLMLPGIDGFEICKQIREEKNTPILMVSAKKDDIDKIRGLGLGADDYITKPFNILELKARIRAMLRRAGAAHQKDKTSRLQVGHIALDTDERSASKDGQAVDLTAKEFDLMELLMRNQGRVFSIDEIYERVWNEPSFAPENTVAVHIRRIREKIEINPREPKYLKVVWGIGYKIEKA